MDSLTIKGIREGLKGRRFSAKELSDFYFKKIEKEDSELGCYLELAKETALNQADKIDNLISEGLDIPSLAGVPVAVKDNILVEGLKSTASSFMLKNYISPYDASCVKRIKEEGAVVLGKTNLDEFAMGSSTENSAFKTTKNPKDKSRVPGGSSGGSAAAVSAGLCCCALGSDTGGSIRQPASFCGVFGLKPTYGAVSRYGLIAFASSLDQIGPLAKNAEDAKILFNAIKGKDKKDSTSIEMEENGEIDFKKLKIGIPKEYFGSEAKKGIEREVVSAIESAIKKIEDMGGRVEEISLPNTKYALSVYYMVSTCEASCNLARYDGIKYGLSEKGENLSEVYFNTRAKGFGAEVKRRIMLGTFALSSGYYDAYYLKSQKVRTGIKEDFEKSFKKVDAIFTPVSPTVAFKIGEKTQDPLSMYLSDIFTISANLAGIPALSVPLKTKGLPVGLQILGNYFEESKLFQIAKLLE
ncbi:MAG: aspartyl/glutamyl-tRNA amidotransferase subunit A [Candidatus Nealsonbacteria bacterium RIFOXYB1_FULL_40_15]|uniref:Glutamyl-tRNA(Gln) amidotransferase subunit A n=2 Tax=Candidatus Nealsoniibacteriota TaxID=1817911 RepID=A0A1G2ELP9_9BACT|nr:MAG: aspartyl/glutamyl-tRNA amidotransferase subunit A [Candidatus Nealsonbacteria bacterium RIFOXYC1_FULL_40_7]OGZ27780.1 MAG: aspartyl/glutamyl-tRNA amidotransferase subunit A [Candidatus Nealsonbacteria bacterium RIFOXYB1_FULL_40_15]